MLGYFDDDGALQYAGNVGTGWDTKTGSALHKRLVKIEVDASPFAGPPIVPGRWSRRESGGERWVEPQLVAEVSFAEWTPDGHIRHPLYLGLREDKAAREVRRGGLKRPVVPPATNTNVLALLLCHADEPVTREG